MQAVRRGSRVVRWACGRREWLKWAEVEMRPGCVGSRSEMFFWVRAADLRAAAGIT
jgi:hypothetical protein